MATFGIGKRRNIRQLKNFDRALRFGERGQQHADPHTASCLRHARRQCHKRDDAEQECAKIGSIDAQLPPPQGRCPEMSSLHRFGNQPVSVHRKRLVAMRFQLDQPSHSAQRRVSDPIVTFYLPSSRPRRRYSAPTQSRDPAQEGSQTQAFCAFGSSLLDPGSAIGFASHRPG